MATHRTLFTILAAGAALPASAQAEPIAVPNRVTTGVPAGHIYYNPATGQRVVTPYNTATPRIDSNPLWLNNNAFPCMASGSFGAVGIIDDPDLDADGLGDVLGGDCDSGPFPCEHSWYSWTGDIAFDCVIDCFVFAYATSAPDVDLNGDMIGDGIAGLSVGITFSDNDNGLNASDRYCLNEFAVFDLPGDLGPPVPGATTIYFVTIDLGALAPSLVFELGDSDGIDDSGVGNSGSVQYGFPTGADLDADGLHDFSYAIRFDQSSLGTSGAPGLTKGLTAFLIAAPKLGNPGDLPPNPADATGVKDEFDIYEFGPSCTFFGTTPYIGNFYYGGFSCEPGAHISSASAYLELFGPADAHTCRANFDASPLPANFTDVVTFLNDFAGACTPAIGNFNSTGACDFTDVVAFLTSFASAQCGN